VPSRSGSTRHPLKTSPVTGEQDVRLASTPGGAVQRARAVSVPLDEPEIERDFPREREPPEGARFRDGGRVPASPFFLDRLANRRASAVAPLSWPTSGPASRLSSSASRPTFPSPLAREDPARPARRLAGGSGRRARLRGSGARTRRTRDADRLRRGAGRAVRGARALGAPKARRRRSVA
jgi:hypothetical protein